jgi:hypothetical protein
VDSFSVAEPDVNLKPGLILGPEAEPKSERVPHLSKIQIGSLDCDLAGLIKDQSAHGSPKTTAIDPISFPAACDRFC